MSEINTACPPGLIRDNSLPDLAARINEAHHLAIHHGGKAIENAIACGEMLLEAKRKVPHGKWLPWLRENVTFGERSAQGYMRIAQRQHEAISDCTSLRDALSELAVPRRYWRDAVGLELDHWMAISRAADATRPQDVKDWTIKDAQRCAEQIRAFDAIMHRHGICPDVGNPEPCCTICGDKLDAKREANTQRVADLGQRAEAAE